MTLNVMHGQACWTILSKSFCLSIVSKSIVNNMALFRMFLFHTEMIEKKETSALCTPILTQSSLTE